MIPQPSMASPSAQQAFICDSNEGNEMVIDAYKKHAYFVKEALEGIVEDTRENSV